MFKRLIRFANRIQGNQPEHPDKIGLGQSSRSRKAHSEGTVDEPVHNEEL